MAIRSLFSADDIRKMIRTRVDRIEKAIIVNLQYLGEQCVNKARESGDYTDRTGNLRSSIGYLILNDGVVVNTSSFGGGYGEGGEKGASTGEAVAREVAKDYPHGYVLVVVAGMNYAVNVEATGRDVLSSAEHYAEIELPQMISQLKSKILKMT